MKHIFIVNPAAGSANSAQLIKNKLENGNFDVNYEVYVTSASGDATRYIKKLLASEDGEYRFYSCGGDGTLNEVVNGAAGNENASVTVYPCGSGNDFIKYYGTADDFKDIGELIKAENQKIDLMKVCGKYAVNAVHFGLDSYVLKIMEKVRRLAVIGGRNAYTTGVIAAFINGMKTVCGLKADGKDMGGEKLLLCTLCNGRYVGGSYKCAPLSSNSDGLIEVCKVSPVSRFMFLKLMGIYKKGGHLSDPRFKKYISYTRAKSVEIEAENGIYISIDGELAKVKSCRVEIAERVLNFAVPKKFIKDVETERKAETVVK